MSEQEFQHRVLSELAELRRSLLGDLDHPGGLAGKVRDLESALARVQKIGAAVGMAATIALVKAILDLVIL